jgi:hypothetical protein
LPTNGFESSAPYRKPVPPPTSLKKQDSCKPVPGRRWWPTVWRDAHAAAAVKRGGAATAEDSNREGARMDQTAPPPSPRTGQYERPRPRCLRFSERGIEKWIKDASGKRRSREYVVVTPQSYAHRTNSGLGFFGTSLAPVPKTRCRCLRISGAADMQSSAGSSRC